MKNQKMTRPLIRIFIVTSLVTTAIGLAGCAKSTDEDKVRDAQACLDKSTSSTALNCLTPIESLDTESANLIKCSAYFVYQEFADPNRLIQISNSMKNTSGGSSASATALGLLAFSKPNTTAAATYANDAFSACTKSKSKGMTLLASMAKIATEVVANGGAAILTDCDATSPSYNATTCQTTVASNMCNASDATVGQAAITAYQQSCLGAAQQNSVICQEYASVGAASGNAAAVGGALKDQLAASNCP